ncbi:putative N-alkane-inducible cytochrome P450 [Aspergillus carlsbadensis]|nr:putative N-alkane-inducible cytochrome P450 [Aspergillus carlsbadensis]
MNQWKLIVTWGVLSLVAVYISSFLYSWIKVRRLFHRLRKQGMPMPPWNSLVGHLPFLAAFMKTVPKDAGSAMTFATLSSEYDLDPCFYIDAWPFGFSGLVVTSPDLAVQACQSMELAKPYYVVPLMSPMTGGSTIFDTNGPEAKRGREVFHQGFSMRSVFGYLPCIVQEVEVYVDRLRELAKSGDNFLLDVLACRCVMDIIGNATMDTRFMSQRRFHPVAAAMRDTIDWEWQIETGRYFSRMNPVRWLKQWSNGRVMDYYIGIELETKYAQSKRRAPATLSKPKTLIELAVDDHIRTNPTTAPSLDPKFKAWATAQIRLFLFVGHDSTAVAITYSHYLLSKHPKILANVREEQDAIFGTDLTKTGARVRQRPELLHQLHYTLAVIKEALRLFAPANGLRDGHPDVSLCDPNTGIVYPTNGCAIWILHHAIHRNVKYWPYPDSFIPDRCLVEPGHPLYPPVGGWRPFEHGARDCIGQNLAFVDILTTLLMTTREFDFQDQYAEWDRLHPWHGLNTMFGERAYMIRAGSGRPAQGMPCKFTLSNIIHPGYTRPCQKPKDSFHIIRVSIPLLFPVLAPSLVKVHPKPTVQQRRNRPGAGPQFPTTAKEYRSSQMAQAASAFNQVASLI